MAGAALSVLMVVRLRHDVREALAQPSDEARPLRFEPVPPLRQGAAWWGAGTVSGVAAWDGRLLAAGGFGVWVSESGVGNYLRGLPSQEVAALVLWRGEPVVALESGGVFRWREGRWSEAVSGFGRLDVRALQEAPGGELIVAARQGLFVASAGGATLERRDRRPFRSVDVMPGAILAGGEDGLVVIEGRRVRSVPTDDPWIETVAATGRTVAVVTASGLLLGPLDRLEPVAGGDDVVSGVWDGGAFLGIVADGAKRVRRIVPGGRASDLPMLAAPRRLLVAGEGTVFADTDAGLLRRTATGFSVARPADPSELPGGSAHVGALASVRGGEELVVGLFDGGILRGRVGEGGVSGFMQVAGSKAWGVNALLAEGDVAYVASLRGACRLVGDRLEPLPGPGAAFALAATRSGLAIGYGQGVALPGPRLLSAFHGLPGNQALALATSPSPRGGRELVVGTPSGLGAIDGERVSWRVTREEGKLPHPWVTALARDGDDLIVGTYGGGAARRRPDGSIMPFPETAGMKVSAGALHAAGGTIFMGTEGRGLLRLSGDRFVPVAASLPSSWITSLASSAGALWVGTDQGIARVPLSADPSGGVL